jgi:hypothetical protein
MPHVAPAWVNGELSVWMDADRVPAMQQLGRQSEYDFGIKVHVDWTENIPNNFPLPPNLAKGLILFCSLMTKSANGRTAV